MSFPFPSCLLKGSGLFGRLVLALLIPLLLMVPQARGEKSYTLAVLPQYTPVQMYRMLAPLALYLRSSAKIRVQVKPYPSFRSFVDGVERGEAEISYQDPAVALKLSDKMEPIAAAVYGDRVRTRGMVVVPKDSAMRGLRDLKDHRVVVVSYLSAAGFVSQGATLSAMGLNPFVALKIYEAVRNCQENVLLDVTVGNADAGFLEERVGKALIRKLGVQDAVRIVGYTARVPQWIVSVRRDLSKTTKLALLNALLNLPESVVKAMGVDGFLPAYRVDFDGLAAQIEKLNALRGDRQ